MKYYFLGIFIVIVAVISALALFYKSQNTFNVINPLGKEVTQILEKPLEKYSFERLQKRNTDKSQIIIGELQKDEETFSSYLFYFKTNNQRVSGIINIPKESGTYPVLVMFRGYVDKEIYTSGEGTRRTAEEFARNGFITLSPDFLGYGQSDNPSALSLEERFQTYTTALSLLDSLPTLNGALESVPDALITADISRTGLWGHSNGGHIALSILAITKKEYPTVLWAPVTKPFPYSILYFTDEFDDEGKSLRKVVADFEKDYDVFDYSPSTYYKWITAPLQIHQGTNDEAVPVRWSDQFVEQLNNLEIENEYYTYQGENHNFNNGYWEEVVNKNVLFYLTNFEEKIIN